MTEYRLRETIRYLGFGKNAVDEKTKTYIDEAFEILEKCERKRFVYRIFSCECISEEEVLIGALLLKSKRLAKNLKDCEEAVVCAATLGTDVDRMLKRLGVTDMAKAVVFQAACAAFLEEYINMCQEELKHVFEKKGRYLRPRFSPGYGDLTVEIQSELLRSLDASNTIGLTCTAMHMLVPSKSVTAFIGISKEKTVCNHRGCESCDKTDCIYRRC